MQIGTVAAIDSGVHSAALRSATPADASRTTSASAVKAGSRTRRSLSACIVVALPKSPKTQVRHDVLLLCLLTHFIVALVLCS